MSLEKIIAKLFRMNEKSFKKHSNPLSGYTRLPTIILLALALWSRVWIGWWFVIPVILVLAWIWINPRVFPEPKKVNAWMSKGVWGEWIWINQDKIEIPEHHRTAPRILRTVAAIGIVPYIWGILFLDPMPTILGIVIMYFGKLWFVDRMVWLYEDMKDKVHVPME